LLSGVDALADCSAADSSLGLAFFVGSVSSSVFESELVWAPPVLTTTPGGAWVVVEVVEVVVGSAVGSVGAVVGFAVGSAEVDDSVDVDESVAVDSVDSEEDDSEDGVSAHATGNPYPVTTAAPTPSATAKPPTRPTYIDERMVLRIRQQSMASGVFAK
jgi:hypothetical protein